MADRQSRLECERTCFLSSPYENVKRMGVSKKRPGRGLNQLSPASRAFMPRALSMLCPRPQKKCRARVVSARPLLRAAAALLPRRYPPAFRDDLVGSTLASERRIFRVVASTMARAVPDAARRPHQHRHPTATSTARSKVRSLSQA